MLSCGLSWNDNRKGELVSASNDGAVCIWSLEGGVLNGLQIKFKAYFLDGGRKKDGFLAPLRIYTDCHSEEKVLDVGAANWLTKFIRFSLSGRLAPRS